MTNDSSHSQPAIRPAAFDISIDPDPRDHASRRTLRVILGVTALAVLTFGLFVVIVLLPRWVDTAPADLPVSERPSVAADAVDANAEAPARKPEDDPAGTGRADTQALLREALEKLDELESLKADTWAKTEVHAIRDSIAQGEKAYREKRYNAAQNLYLDSAARIERVLGRLPTHIESLIDAGLLALQSGDSAAATRAFEATLAIEPENERASAGLARAQTLDQVLALISQAEGYERLGQAEQALSAYREALALDAEAPGAAVAVRRIESERRAAAFRKAMSQGLAALEAQRFTEARRSLERALAIDSGAPEARDALKQLENAETTHRIDSALGAANAAERAEKWSTAIEQYATALKLDPRLAAAGEGKRRAEAYARLHGQLSSLLARPERLTSVAVQREAEAVLSTARGTEMPTGLSLQAAALERALELARTPVAIALRSNAATQVTIYRVGEFGAFEERAVSLMPGDYTAVGKRDGYRDVRVEFRVEPGDDTRLITIQCEEKFAFGS